MNLETQKNRLPDYAKDLKLNLSSLAMEPSLTEQQRAGTFIACALAQRRNDARDPPSPAPCVLRIDAP